MNGISERWERNIVIASGFAARAHAGAFRKDNITPYIAHPARVAALVRAYGGRGVDISAAWLHDVIEDVTDGENIVSECIMSMDATNNEVVAVEGLVRALTKNVNMKPRAAREEDMIRRVLEGGSAAVMVKMCDRVDNLIDFPHSTQKPGFAVLYLQESKDLSDALKVTAMTTGHGELHTELEAAIANMKLQIEAHANTG
jgi:(p)ppGpp synthase/HD superfamily hydrolase